MRKNCSFNLSVLIFYKFVLVCEAFAACRAAQRNSISSVYNCKPVLGGAANKDDAAKQLQAAAA